MVIAGVYHSAPQDPMTQIRKILHVSWQGELPGSMPSHGKAGRKKAAAGRPRLWGDTQVLMLNRPVAPAGLLAARHR